MVSLMPNEKNLLQTGQYLRYISLIEKRLKDEQNLFVRQDLDELMKNAKEKYTTAIAPQIGVCNALFYHRKVGLGVCARARFGNKTPNGTEMKKAIANAQQAVMHFLHTGFLTIDDKLTIELESMKSEVPDGASIGLAAALIILSKLMALELPTHFAVSAAISETGHLQTVDYIDEKIEAAKNANKHLKYILIAEEQKLGPQPELKVKRAATLKEAVIQVWGEETYQQLFVPEIENPHKTLQAMEYYKRLQDNRKTRELANILIENLKNAASYPLQTIYAYANAELGLQFTHESRLDEAEAFFLTAKQTLKALGNNADPSIPLYKTFNAYGIYLFDNYRYSEALKEFEYALTFLKERKFPAFYQIESWNSLAQYYTKTNQFEIGKKYLERALKESKTSRAYIELSRIYCYLAENSMSDGDFPAAEKYLKSADEAVRQDKPIQHFFNDFYRAMLLFRWNQKERFLHLFEKTIYPNYLENPVQSSAHRGMMHSWAASMYSGAKQQKIHIKAAKELLYRKNDIFTSILLLQTEATHRLRNGEKLLLENGKAAEIIKEAAHKSDFLKENLPSNPQSEKDWQAIESAIKF